MALGFSGDVADYYAQFRRGYPPEVLDALRDAFGLDGEDTVLDLGCGTGQLAVPLASRVGAVVGMDPEPDMLRLAREAAAREGVRNATWMLGADTDVPALGTLLGGRSGRPLAATVIGQALHWMDHEALFRNLSPLLRAGGGIAVIANGTPLWLQDSDWSRALREALEKYFDTELRASCGTGAQDRERYARALEAAGCTRVREIAVDYSGELGFDELVGGVFSALSASDLPAPEERPAFAESIRRSLPGEERFTEHVRVSALVGVVGVAGVDEAAVSPAARGGAGR